MNLALRLPALPGLPTQRLKALWSRHRWAVLALWLAFIAGLMGADLWFAHRQSVPQPEARLEVGPTPLPLVAGIDPVDRPLPPAPAEGLEETTTAGKLPVTAPDGRTPLAVYAYPFDKTEARPRISIILTDAGPQQSLMQDALKRLPGSVALAFNALTPGLGQIMADARQAGHETLLMIPADGSNPLNYDPGPGALRSTLSVNENMQRLHILMGKATGYVGLFINPETMVLSNANLAGALLTTGQQRGLEIISADQNYTNMGAAQGSPTALAAIQLDRSLNPADLDAALEELERQARMNGSVIATSALYPFVVARLANWLPTLSAKGIAIAPVSAAANPVKSSAAAPAPADTAHTEQSPAPAGDHH